MRVIIMSGVPGSGKSHEITRRCEEFDLIDEPYVWKICSADHYFEELGHFDPSKLGEAHGQCLRRFVTALRNDDDEDITHVFVDNTNTTLVELAPYVALAQAYSAEIELVRVLCDPEIAFKRNVHGVPLAGVQAMDRRLRDLKLPPFWQVKVTEVGEP